MKGTVIISGALILIAKAVIIVFISVFPDKKKMESDFGVVKRGYFEINITAEGELVPENETDIYAPDIVKNRNFRAAGVKILDLVPEGTEVNKGDYIARLDPSTFENRLKDEMDSLDRIRTNLKMVILDTAVTLAAFRDDIRNQYYVFKEAGVTLEKSAYETASVIRRAKLDLERSNQIYDQLQNNYQLRYAQALTHIKIIELSLRNQTRVVNDLKNVLEGFVVTSPSYGIVIYKKDRRGNKVKTGSLLNPFNPVIASLPDLSEIISKVYISEVEINKIRTGQGVEISVDAFPGRRFAGKVVAIANIGDQLPNSDSKVFEVDVKLIGTDPSIRPSMTTNNKFIVKTFDNVAYVPTASLQTGLDGITFVYTRDWKKQVIAGESNDRNTIIVQGLEEGASVWLRTPDNTARFRIKGNDMAELILKQNP